MSLVNVWHLRRVAEASAKPCEMVCYKPTTSVLITPDNKDHFYICQGHLKDKGFASPIINAAEAAAKKKEDMDREIELIKQEYEEKMEKKKKSKESKAEEKETDKDKDKKDGKKEEEDDKKAEKEKDDKIKAVTGQPVAPTAEDVPRIYALNKVFYQKRLDRLRNLEVAKRNRERLKNPVLFPSVPNGNPD